MGFGEVIDYASDGSSVLRRGDGKVIFLDRGIIGEQVKFKELKKAKA